jgi:hypothetical protein
VFFDFVDERADGELVFVVLAVPEPVEADGDVEDCRLGR